MLATKNFYEIAVTLNIQIGILKDFFRISIGREMPNLAINLIDKINYACNIDRMKRFVF